MNLDGYPNDLFSSHNAIHFIHFLRSISLAVILLVCLTISVHAQFGGYQDYYQEYERQSVEMWEEWSEYIHEEPYPNPQDDVSPCQYSEGAAACQASAGRLRVGTDGLCYCDLPDGRSCDLVSLMSGQCELQPGPTPTPDSVCAGTLRGQVVDAATGLPVSGATVDPNCRNICPKTDADGRYSITSPDISLCPTTSYYVKCSADGYQQAGISIITDVSGDATCDFHLIPLSSPPPEPEMYSFTVLVTDSQGDPIEGAEIVVDDKPQVGVTGPDGSLEIGLTDGQHSSQASRPGYSSGNWSGYLNHTTADGFTIALTRDQKCGLSVSVVNQSHAALAGASVYADGGFLGITDNSGVLGIELEYGYHNVTATMNGKGAGSWEGMVEYSSPSVVEVIVSGPATSGDAQPKIKILDIIPVRESEIAPGERTTFEFCVEYDLGENDRGKINAAVDRFSTGGPDEVTVVPDDEFEIVTGQSRTGTHCFRLQDDIGADWSHAYVSVDLYASKKDQPIPATYSAFDYVQYQVRAGGSPAEIRFEGTAVEHSEGFMPGAPTHWMVTVDKLLQGPNPCVSPVKVTTYQAISPPVWGSVESGIESGDKVDVYGSYSAEDGCSVTLHGSESYYLKKSICKGVISGHVIDDDTGLAIAGASLSFDLHCQSAVSTDAGGYYELAAPGCNICGLVYSPVTCSADGYLQETKSLVTDVDGMGVLDFRLKRAADEGKSPVLVQGEVVETPHCSPAGSQPDYYAKVRIKKVIENPRDVLEISPGRVITVRGRECSAVNDLVKGRCYEFGGEWSEGALWIVFANVKQIDCDSDGPDQETGGCGEILKYDISDGRYTTGQIILADMEYKSHLNYEADFKGVLLLRSPDGDIYSNSKTERTPSYRTDQFGYWNRGSQIDVRIPENAPNGWFSAKLQLINQDTGTVCDETEWLDAQFEIYQPDDVADDCREVKLRGTCVEVKDLCWGAQGHEICEIWVVDLDEVESGQRPSAEVVEVYSGLPSTRGYHDDSIQVGEGVEIYGCGKDKYVSIAEEERYYIRRISSSPCNGDVSGHVYDADTGLPIKSAAIDVVNSCIACPTTNSTGYYEAGSPICNLCPNTAYNVTCSAEGYESASKEVTTDAEGNMTVDFYLDAKQICTGIISGRVFDAKTGSPIEGVGVCDDEDPDVCNVCYTTNESGYYAMGPVAGQDSGCHFCPDTSYRIRVYGAECYNLSDGLSAYHVVTTDHNGNASGVDFRLTPIKCRSSQCKEQQAYGRSYTDECGNKYREHNTCSCEGCKCVCDDRMVVETEFRPNNKPKVRSFSGPGIISVGEQAKFTLVGEDPDKDRFYFYIDWDDGTTQTGLASTGEEVVVYHTWRSVDCLEVRARAIDVCGAESDWDRISLNFRA
ncbi:MAG: hypothetical protein A4E47_00409 [Methanosaeta sp. PtaU1.Bin028]|nr:MAG: hypothetical protein A4E47_00409 [Methanosaeta sp. PtaU1.Bin028]